MKNVRVYEGFMKNTAATFNLRYLRISLTRTFIFSFEDDATRYYRKATRNPRKILMIGKEKIFRTPFFNSQNINYEKYGMCDIKPILYEYITFNTNNADERQLQFDVAKNNWNSKRLFDSIIVNDNNDDVITMCFDDNKKDNKFHFDNVFWINSSHNYDNFSNRTN